MVKKCIICEEEATHKIKNTSDFYCKGCAEENFSDLNMLVTLEEEAQRLKQFLKQQVEEVQQDTNQLQHLIEGNE